ncbi:MAG: DNA polymerase III delta prime subunit [uncultured Nocardioides sp.]|uniref:DNA polymerase III subunit delta' n=1 Tax=uncultured Nocardioides sp. TaxID=198441 RepID=A0A6J4N193_9ACTN|nr:MAG: DNA polymerase III delta prime subunit [uncultured Nocardioides sp.]
MTVWDSLVGQSHIRETLQGAVTGHGMTHAWLFTGPPGSGRSNAALAFAAALQCVEGGCGSCEDCRTALAGSHPDVRVRRSERVIISVDLAREWVREAALMPVRGRWQAIIVEDADRLHERANNALLKAIEEPTPRTVWILCAPQVDDVLPTIRSRTRNIILGTPRAEDVADFLVQRFDVSPTRAAHAARASQGHIGRAKALAMEEDTRGRRLEVVRLPARLTTLGSCMTAATNLAELATEEATADTDRLNAKEVQELEALYGSDRKSRSARSAKAAFSDLEKDQKARLKRRILDSVDRQLTELLSVYRDVLVLQTGAGGHLVNEEQRGEIEELARRTTPEDTLHRIDAVYEARRQMMEFNVPPLLALESMMVSLKTS